MIACLDTSALLKRYFPEAGSDALDRLLVTVDLVCLSRLVHIEAIAAVRRAMLTGDLVETDGEKVLQALGDDLVTDFRVVSLTDQIAQATVGVLTGLSSLPLRAADALHLQTAIHLEADLFVTSDRQQAAAGEALGLTTHLIAAT